MRAVATMKVVEIAMAQRNPFSQQAIARCLSVLTIAIAGIETANTIQSTNGLIQSSVI